ncbi:MAG: PUA domain-containing protein, partial [Longimicrobiales bacterium]
ALRSDGGSLLPAGVVEVKGTFERGDAVRLVGPSNGELGRGIARYDSIEVRKIAGHHSDEIPEILGYASGSVVIHRDDLILL